MKKVCTCCGYWRRVKVYNSNYSNIICLRRPEYPRFIDQNVSSLYNVSVTESIEATEVCSKDPVDLFNYRSFRE